MRNKTETVMDQKDRAMRGWLGEPQPQRDHKPSHALKWYKIMGAAELSQPACGRAPGCRDKAR